MDKLLPLNQIQSNVLIMGYSDRSHTGNKTTFSQLDAWVKRFIAESIALELLVHLDRSISVEALIHIFERFDVDVDVSPEETFSIRRNEKLEVAVKNISAQF